MALDPIAIATDGYACEDGGQSSIPIATGGYVCYRIFQVALSGVITMTGALFALFIPGAGTTNAQKNQGGTAINIDIGVD